MPKLTLEKAELARYERWNEEHLKDHHDGEEPPSGAIGGRVTFEVTHTSVGTVVKVSCAFCKNSEEDLTNYDDW